MSDIKEINFIKQVERTAKRDAYQKAIEYIEQFGEKFGLETLKEMMESHTKYLDGLPFEYDYATQTLVNKRTYEISITEIDNYDPTT